MGVLKMPKAGLRCLPQVSASGVPPLLNIFPLNSGVPLHKSHVILETTAPTTEKQITVWSWCGKSSISTFTVLLVSSVLRTLTFLSGGLAGHGLFLLQHPVASCLSSIPACLKTSTKAFFSPNLTFMDQLKCKPKLSENALSSRSLKHRTLGTVSHHSD